MKVSQKKGRMELSKIAALTNSIWRLNNANGVDYQDCSEENQTHPCCSPLAIASFVQLQGFRFSRKP